MDAVGVAQREAWQEGVVPGVDQLGFQLDGLSRAQSEVRLLPVDRRTKITRQRTVSALIATAQLPC